MMDLTARQHRNFALKYYDLFMINGRMSDFDIHCSEPPVSCARGLYTSGRIVGVCNTQLLIYRAGICIKYMQYEWPTCSTPFSNLI